MEAADRWRRATLAAGALGVHVLLGYAFLFGLAGRSGVPGAESVTVVDLIAEPVPERRIEPPAKKVTRRGGVPTPPNLRARATEVVAPPVVLRPDPPLIVAAPEPAIGADASTGASLDAGPGSGAGGTGDGSGEGEGDDGTVHSQWLSGRFKRSDYPRAALEAGIGGKVAARVTVGPRGRVTNCEIIESSGNRDLDETTCRVITRRFRYEPGRDALGRAISDEWIEEHSWVAEVREEWIEERR